MWPGKKMPGRMGGVRRTVQSVLVYKVISPLACACLASECMGTRMLRCCLQCSPESLI